MLSLSGVRWGEFVIGDLFKVEGTITTKPENLIKNGKTPRITCSAANNGLDDVYANKATERGHVLTIDSATVGFVAYQEYDFIATDHVEKLTLRNRKLSRYLGLFCVAAISYAVNHKYNYGYKFSQDRIRRQTIMLPVDESGRPDYAFMERFMRNIEQRLIRAYVEQVSVRLRNPPPQKLLSLRGVRWGTFYLRDVFTEIRRGKRLKTEDHITGNVPYVSSSAINNGVDNFIGNNDGVRKFNDCMTIANSGSVGKTFYHDYEFVASDHVTALKAPNMDRYIYLFIAAMAQRLEEKYSFNREINETRINREKIMLPAAPSGLPDWQLMHSYMLSLESQCLSAVINHFTAKLHSGV